MNMRAVPYPWRARKAREQLSRYDCLLTDKTKVEEKILLFEIFAELQKHLPWTSLVSAPTRVEKLETVSA